MNARTFTGLSALIALSLIFAMFVILYVKPNPANFERIAGQLSWIFSQKAGNEPPISPPIPPEVNGESDEGLNATQEILESIPTDAPVVRAVVVKSWGSCSPRGLVWAEINANWRSFGQIPVQIEYATPGLCDGPVTYEKLAASGADVLILSDPAGGARKYASSEIEAIRRYAREGHDLIGTYAVFQYAATDNRELASLFGLSTTGYQTRTLASPPAYALLNPSHPLLAKLSDPHQGSGYAATQYPKDGSWDEDDLDGAIFLARSSDWQAAITLFDEGSYRALFISGMPEYGGDFADQQLLYNALTYSQRLGQHTPLIFIPGLMGSRLFNTLNGVDHELWADLNKLTSIFSFTHPLMPLEMAYDGVTPAKDEPAYTTIHTLPGSGGIITRLQGYTWGQYVDEDFYGTLVGYFLDRGYIENEDFWVYPYDWRKDLRTSAQELEGFLQAVQEQTGSPQVDIVAHSLGGLLARQYIIEPGRAEKVRNAVLLGTPFLGTPKAYHALLDGDCLYKLPVIGYCLPKKEVVKTLIPNFPAINQILPTQGYFRLKGGGFYGRGQSLNVAGNCGDCLSFEETYTSSTITTLNQHLFGFARQFHTDLSDYTQWNGVQITILAGNHQQTLVGIREFKRWSWLTFRTITIKEPVFHPNGDGTVTLLSASLANSQTNLNLLGNANLLVYNSDHMDLVKKPEVLAAIYGVLNPQAGAETLTSSQEAAQEVAGVQIIANGAAAIHAYDAQGNHTGPVEEMDYYEENIPGSVYFSGDETVMLALTGGEDYAITVIPAGDIPLDIHVVRSKIHQPDERSLYLGLPNSEETRLVLVGDPSIDETWYLQSVENQESLLAISPTRTIFDHQQVDETPPVTTISLDGIRGESGWFESPVTVAITARDDPGGSGVARIEYGFQENSQVFTYSGPFEVDPAEVSMLYALAVDLAGNYPEQASLARIGPDRVFIPLIRR
jgi:pimeloyl-ACP methyl ester carboxylesterase